MNFSVGQCIGVANGVWVVQNGRIVNFQET